MAAPRAYWKGHIRLSLVTIQVALYSALDRGSAVALRQIHKPSGKRVRYEKVVPGLGPIDTDDIVKGFELDDEGFVVLEPDELDEIKLESKNTIKLVQFVDLGDIDPRYYERPYYVAPEGDAAEEGFVVIREALRQQKKVALGQMTMRGREYLVALRPCGRGLLLETLRYADEVRSADRIFDDIPDLELDADMLGLATELVQRKSGPFDPRAFHDAYALALRELIERKRKGMAIVGGGDDDRRRDGGQVIDLMEALKKSVAEDGGAKQPRAKPKPEPKPTADAKPRTGAKSSSGSKSGAGRRAKAG